jgi:hypothetical protein
MITAGSMAHTWQSPLGHPPGPGYPPGPGHPSTTPKSSFPLGMLADSHLDTMELSKDILEEVLYEGEKGLGTGVCHCSASKDVLVGSLSSHLTLTEKARTQPVLQLHVKSCPLTYGK